MSKVAITNISVDSLMMSTIRARSAMHLDYVNFTAFSIIYSIQCVFYYLKNSCLPDSKFNIICIENVVPNIKKLN